MTDQPNRAEMSRIVEGAPAAPWLIVQSKPGKELEARMRLAAQHFEVYLPMRPLDAVTAKRRGVSAVPFFPRILFARATLDAYRWQVIFNTIGVHRVMCDPMKPRGLRPDLVEAIRRRELQGFLKLGLIDPSKPPPPPPSKDPRRWVKLADVVEGLINEPLDAHRGSVLVSLLEERHGAVAQDIRRY